MKITFRVLALTLLAVMALGLVAPTLGQDSQGGMTETDGLLTYAANDCDYGGIVKSIEAVDALTVKFTLCVPDPAFPAKIAFSSLGIQPREHLEATGGGGEALFRNPVGTGPYMLENWDLGNEIVLTRFDDYWGEKAKEPTVIFRWASEAAARLTELQAGTVDGIDNPGTGDIEVIQNDPNLAFYPRPGFNVFYIGMNNTKPPFDNHKVRQAVAYTIDRQRIVDNFYPAGSIVADQFIPPDSMDAGHTAGFEPLGLNPDMAMQLLDEAASEGVELPISATLNYRDVVRTYLPNVPQVAADIQAQLNALGDGKYFNVSVEVMESGAFIDASSRGELAFFLLGWNGDWPDATNFLDTHFGVGSDDKYGEKIPELTAVLAQAAQLADPAARDELYAQANAIIRDQVPMVAVAHGASGVAFKASIAGAHASPLGNEQFAVMEDPDDDNIIWMQNGEPAGLYCGDETDGEALRVCEQIVESLLAYEVGGSLTVPSLAEDYSANDTATEWTLNLREGVKFHDGSDFDANDVVVSYGIQWDAANPLHVGRDGGFEYWAYIFGAFLNAPSAE